MKKKNLLVIICISIFIMSVLLLWKFDFKIDKKQIQSNNSLDSSNTYEEEKPKSELDELNDTLAQLYQQGQYSQALDLAKKMLDLTRKSYSGTPDELKAIYNLAVISADNNEQEMADKLFMEAKEKVDQVLNENNRDFIKGIGYGYQKYYKDFILGGLKIGDSEDETIKLLGQPLQNEKGNMDHYFEGNIEYKNYMYDGISMQFYKDEDRFYIADHLKIDTYKYSTFRGLTVGDSVEKIYLAYGYSEPGDNNSVEYQVMYKTSDGVNRWQAIIFELDSSNKKVKSIKIRPVYD